MSTFQGLASPPIKSIFQLPLRMSRLRPPQSMLLIALLSILQASWRSQCGMAWKEGPNVV